MGGVSLNKSLIIGKPVSAGDRSDSTHNLDKQDNSIKKTLFHPLIMIYSLVKNNGDSDSYLNYE